MEKLAALLCGFYGLRKFLKGIFDLFVILNAQIWFQLKEQIKGLSFSQVAKFCRKKLLPQKAHSQKLSSFLKNYLAKLEVKGSTKKISYANLTSAIGYALSLKNMALKMSNF